MGFGFWVLGFGFWVLGFEFWVLGFGFEFWGWELRDLDFVATSARRYTPEGPKSLKGHLAHKKHPPPEDHQGTLGVVLL